MKILILLFILLVGCSGPPQTSKYNKGDMVCYKGDKCCVYHVQEDWKFYTWSSSFHYTIKCGNQSQFLVTYLEEKDLSECR